MADAPFETIRESLDIALQHHRTNLVNIFERMSTTIKNAYQIQVSIDNLEASVKEKIDVLKSCEARIARARKWIDTLEPLAEKL